LGCCEEYTGRAANRRYSTTVPLNSGIEYAPY